MRKFTLVISCLLISFSLFSQKRVLGYPEAYKLPMNPYESGKVNEFVGPRTWSDVDRKRAWRVVPERSGVMAYKEPSINSGTLRELEWGKSYYVSETKGKWLYLIDARVDLIRVAKVKDKFGWVQASDLLLWNEALINPRTKIHLKTLLLNRYDNINNIPCEDQELVKVFSSPTGNDLRITKKIYNFYFVYKIEGQRYLLGDAPVLTKRADVNLLGWVDRERLAEWNTRIALEPNFTDAGYQERKAKERFRVKGFEDRFAAEDYSRTGVAGEDGVIWRRDPVSANVSELSKDPKRFLPHFMRYPLLNVSAGGKTLPYFRSAVCDSVIVKRGCDPETGNTIVSTISTQEAVGAEQFLDKYRTVATNFDVFFVVERSGDMSPYKTAIASLAKTIKREITTEQENARVRFGAVTYGDVSYSDKADELIQFSGLASDMSRFQRFIESTEFTNKSTNGDLPAQNFGLKKAMQVADFNPYHSNMVIVLGARGDFSQNRLKKRILSGSELVVDMFGLTDEISKRQLNIFSVQCLGGDSEPFKSFSRNIRGIMLQSATKNFNSNLKKNQEDERVKKLIKEYKIQLPPPSMDDTDEYARKENFELKDGTLLGSIYRIPSGGVALSPDALITKVVTNVNTIVAESIDFVDMLNKYGNEPIPKGGFTRRGIDAIGQLYNQQDLGDDWSLEKFEVYKPVFFAREPLGANNPTFSYVLFWPQQDLANYSEILRRVFVRASDAAPDERRELLVEAYCKLLDEFTGNKESKKDCSDYTIDEIQQVVQGVENEGVSFGSRNIRIGDLLDRKSVSDDEIDTIMNEQVQIQARLKEMLSGSAQEFSFKRGNTTFFWIKVNDLY